MTFLRVPLVPFLALSLAAHLYLFLSWPDYPIKASDEPIPVTFLPAPKAIDAEALVREEKSRARPSKAPRSSPKRSTARLEDTANEFSNPAAKQRLEERPAYDSRESMAPQEIVRRRLPDLKEILPPVTWDRQEAESQDTGPVMLNTRERKYVSYFTSIKQAIQIVWDYPESALRHGLEGKLVLEFTILGNGALEGTRLVRSSGFAVLDDEAIRAVQAASPFHPIPPWIGRNRLDIIASFEYHDNRMKYLMP